MPPVLAIAFLLSFLSWNSVYMLLLPWRSMTTLSLLHPEVTTDCHTAKFNGHFSVLTLLNVSEVQDIVGGLLLHKNKTQFSWFTFYFSFLVLPFLWLSHFFFFDEILLICLSLKWWYCPQCPFWPTALPKYIATGRVNFILVCPSSAF